MARRTDLAVLAAGLALGQYVLAHDETTPGDLEAWYLRRLHWERIRIAQLAGAPVDPGLPP